MLDRMAEADPAFEMIRQPNSGGPASPRNRALELVRGRYIFFLDQDDYLSPDALEAMVRIADENGTDVVLARMKGVGGRGAPGAMFTRTVQRTDVFSSLAYRTLSPIKLFRTSMVRSLGLRFDEEFRVHEDIGFVTLAYVKGNGISILADKDYVFWANREDRSNITLSRMKLADRLPGLSHIFDLLASVVPPGPQRDALMRRLFEVETQTLCRAYGLDPDPVLREATFARLREIVANYYTENIYKVFVPRQRVLMRFVSEGDADTFLAYLNALEAASGRTAVLVEGERIFLMLPWFRDPDHPLPDDLFDVSSKLGPYCRVEPLEVDAAGVGVSAVCRLGPLTERVTAVSLIARSRSRGGEVEFPLASRVTSDETSPVVQVEDSIPAGRLLSLPKGEVFDLYLRVAAGETWRERRVAECAPVRKLRILKGSGDRARYGMLTTTPKGSLSFRALDGAELARWRLGQVRRSVARVVRGWFGRARA
jgi:glycosyltransferase involved in cell wall biosynthesis